MNKAQFEKLKDLLLDRGYKIYSQQWHHEDYILGRGFHKEDNKWEENRNAYQIILSIYDYSERSELWDRLPESMKNHVGIEIHVDVSRTVEERIELCAAWHDDTKIEEVERIAENFFKWIETIYPEPREEKPKSY